MPKQESILKVRGTIDELNFYKKDGEFFVRKKGGVSRERIFNDPKFVRTRENMQQFKSLAENLKLFRDSFPNLKKNIPGKIASLPISKLMNHITKLDDVSPRGQHKLSIGIRKPNGIESFSNLALTRGANLNHLFTAPLTFDRVTGVITSDLFIPENQIYYPHSATHYNIQACVVAINFDTMQSEVFYTNALQNPIDTIETSLTLTPTALPQLAGDISTFVIVSFTFSQMSNGFFYPLKNNNGTALQIIDAFNS